MKKVGFVFSISSTTNRTCCNFLANDWSWSKINYKNECFTIVFTFIRYHRLFTVFINRKKHICHELILNTWHQSPSCCVTICWSFCRDLFMFFRKTYWSNVVVKFYRFFKLDNGNVVFSGPFELFVNSNFADSDCNSATFINVPTFVGTERHIDKRVILISKSLESILKFIFPQKSKLQLYPNIMGPEATIATMVCN